MNGGSMMVNILIAWITRAIILHFEMNSALDEKLEPDISDLIILGSLIRGDEISKILHSRLEKGAILLKENPHLRVILTGGNGNKEKFPEAQVMKKVLVEQFGVEEERIIIEDLSKNTFENLLFCKRLISDKRVAIITSEFHSMRVKMITYRLKISCQIIGAKTYGVKRYKWELREHLALIKSLFLDY